MYTAYDVRSAFEALRKDLGRPSSAPAGPVDGAWHIERQQDGWIVREYHANTPQRGWVGRPLNLTGLDTRSMVIALRMARLAVAFERERKVPA